MNITSRVRELSQEELYQVDHDVWLAQEARRMGFPVAGTIRDLYEDAVVLIPPVMKFDWKTDRVKVGRVLHIEKDGEVWEFVLQMEDGTQVSCMYGISYSCYFALPEDTEDFCR